jgi:hypothetical protein
VRHAALTLLRGLGAALCWVIALILLTPAMAAAATSGGANSVWCISAGNCVAVGSYTQANGAQQGLLLSEVRGIWQGDQLATLPSDAAGNPRVDLNHLYCSAGPSCVAVGDYVNGAGSQQAMVLTEHNGVWSAATRVPLPTGAIAGAQQLAELNALWCASASQCVAAGDYTDNQAHQQGLTITETNGRWGQGSTTPVPTNAAPDPQVTLTALDCRSASACDVAGIYNNQDGNQEVEILVGAATHWGSGEANLPGDAALAAQQVQINSLACGDSSNCVGAGAFIDDTGDEQPLILLADGSSFSTVAATMPANADTASNPDAQLTSVFCAGSGNCSMVGDYNDASSNQQGMMLTETDHRFAPATELSLPTDADQSSAGANPQVTLNGLWCSSAGHCVAGGAYTNVSQAEVPLVSSETNGTWNPGLALSLPSGAATNGNQSASLASVFCASSSCSAVGTFTGRGATGEPLLVPGSAEGFARGVLPAAPPTAAALQSSLAGVDAAPPATSLARIATSGLNIRYVATAPGKLTLKWYRLGTLVATTPSLSVISLGVALVKLSLTAAGRRILTHTPAGTAWSIQATAQFTPTPAYGAAVTASRVFQLK